MRLRYVIAATVLVLLTASLFVARPSRAWNQTDAELPVAKKEKPKFDPPNVILISLDTLRPDHLGCYGYGKETSPNLDRLAQQGVVFQKTWTQAPWTLPSHMSLFTSLPPSRHRVDSLNRVLPDETVTLPQVMQQHGYQTTAIVNNAQMRAHWGFNRGFDVWREYEVDTPAGNCENITREAIDWLAEQDDDEPFLLFLHYYDPHDAYAAPAAFRNRFGSSLSGETARAMVWEARYPDQPLPSQKAKGELIGAYDAEISWLDHELGKLFDALPPNTMVVIFSDHGEAFEEHGWTLHGATLFEEETRVALLMRLPGNKHAGRVVDAPAALMDVAPTILRQCGIESPSQFAGNDLTLAMSGDRLPARIITSETKAVIEGRICRSAMAYPWKLIVSEPGGHCELYRLPDETTNLASAEPAAVAALKRHIESGMSHQNYWIFEARGSGKHEVTLDVAGGDVALFVPLGFERGRDGIQTSADGRHIDWVTYPGETPKFLYVELSHPNARLTVDVIRDDCRHPQEISIGASGDHPVKLPIRLPNDDILRPSLERATFDNKRGVRIFHVEGDDAGDDGDNTKRVDEEILRQLRALKYVE
jgi:arylsulfatase A-like enzyme